MPYIHAVWFDLPSAKADELQIGAGLQRVIGFLRSVLPNEPGFVTARGFYSIDGGDTIHIEFQSVWQDWDSLVTHQSTSFAAEKILAHFQDIVPREAFTARTYQEIA